MIQICYYSVRVRRRGRAMAESAPLSSPKWRGVVVDSTREAAEGNAADFPCKGDPAVFSL